MMNPVRSRCCHLLLVGLGIATTLTAQEGGIEVFAGESLFESGLRLSFTELYRSKQGQFAGSREVADLQAQSLDEYRGVLGFDYGLDRNVTLTALVPYVDRTLEQSRTRTSASGLGDLALIGKYRFFQWEGRGSSFNWSLIGGMELPSGATDATQGGMRLAPAVQVGKGSWNPFLATSATYGYQRSRFDATVFYKLNNEGAQSYEDGDFFSVSLSGAYRFWHFKYPGPTFGLRLGLQYRHEGRADSKGVAVENSGADELLFAPALSIHPIPRMDMILGVRVPLYQRYQGLQRGRDIDYIFSLGIRF